MAFGLLKIKASHFVDTSGQVKFYFPKILIAEISLCFADRNFLRLCISGKDFYYFDIGPPY